MTDAHAIVKGSTNHSQFAPLSTAQTVDICRHMQDQINKLMSACAELKRDLAHTDDNVEKVSTSLRVTNAAVGSVQEGLGQTNEVLDIARKELTRTGGHVHQLQSGLERTEQNVAALRDNQKFTNNNIGILKQDIQEVKEGAHATRDWIENRGGKEIKELQEAMHLAVVGHQKNANNAQKIIAEAQQQMEALRESDKNTHALRDDLSKTNTVVHMLEQRLHETGGRLKSCRQHVEDTNAVCLKIHEEHGHVKAHVAAQEKSLKSCHAHVQQVSEGLDNAVVQLKNTQSTLSANVNGLSQTKDLLEKTVLSVRALREGHEMMNAQTQNLQADLAETAVVANKVKAGLRETNSLVLPNLHLDSGSVTGGYSTTLGAPPPRTPLSARGPSQPGTVKKVSMGSTTPNRMAWI